MPTDLDSLREHYDTNMQEMFATVSDFYARYWGDFFHFALFENGRETWEQAFERTHRQYIEDINLAAARSVIELACGRGGFSDFMARHSQAEVLGVDISPVQLARARRFQRDNLRFEQHDIMHIDRIGRTFDAVVFMDAACYLPDKAVAMERISTIMNPGARLLLIDWCKQDGLHGFQEELVLHPFLRCWAVPGLETIASYTEHLGRAGLALRRVDDLTPRVRPNWEHAYEQAIQGIRKITLRDAAHLARAGLRRGRRGIRLLKEQFPAAIYIKAGFDAGFLRYAYFLAEKPTDRLQCQPAQGR